MDDEFEDVQGDGVTEPVEYVLGFGDLRMCFPGLSRDCIEELADTSAVRIQVDEFGEFSFEVGPAAKAVITRHESAAWLREHIREACHLAMLIPTESD